MLEKIKGGDDFVEVAKRHSDDETAKQGGDLGVLERGKLSKEIEDAVFKLQKNELTDVIRTKQGFIFLQVLQHYPAGEQPLDKVEPEIMNRLYQQRMEPALRTYLNTLREESYVVVKPGYTATAVGARSPVQQALA